MTEKADSIGCSAGCKRQQPSDVDAERAGWTRLPISGWWRCPTCTRELRAASQPKPEGLQ